MSNIINLREPHSNATMNMVRKHIAELKKQRDTQEDIKLFEATLRSFYQEAIGADNQQLAA